MLCLMFLLGGLCYPIWFGFAASGSGGGGGDTFSYRIPPAWDYANAHHYSTRAWVQGLQLWVLLTDLKHLLQTAAIVMRLGGVARELVRIIPEELQTGGLVDGVLLDFVT